MKTIYILLFTIFLSCETKKQSEVWDDPISTSTTEENKNAPIGQIEPESEAPKIEVIDEPWKVEKEIAAEAKDKDLVFESESIKDGPKHQVKPVDSAFSEDAGVKKKGLEGRKNPIKKKK